MGKHPKMKVVVQAAVVIVSCVEVVVALFINLLEFIFVKPMVYKKDMD